MAASTRCWSPASAVAASSAERADSSACNALPLHLEEVRGWVRSYSVGGILRIGQIDHTSRAGAAHAKVIIIGKEGLHAGRRRSSPTAGGCAQGNRLRRRGRGRKLRERSRRGPQRVRLLMAALDAHVRPWRSTRQPDRSTRSSATTSDRQPSLTSFIDPTTGMPEQRRSGSVT